MRKLFFVGACAVTFVTRKWKYIAILREDAGEEAPET